MIATFLIVKSNRDSMVMDGKIIGTPVKQLSIVAPSKKRVHGKLQKDIQVRRKCCLAKVNISKGGWIG